MDNDTFLSFNGLMIDQKAHECLLDGVSVPLTPTQYEIAKVLLENIGKIIPAAELYHRVWKTRQYSMSEKNDLSAHIRNLRKRLGDDYRNPRFIATIHKQGYRIGPSASPAVNIQK